MPRSSTATTTAPAAPERLPWTGDDEADRLLAADPACFLIGFVLDQQVTLQKAFRGPLTIRERLGTVDVRELAEMDPGVVADAFAQPPAVHRYPRAMAERVQAMCRLVVETYDGDAARVWTGAADAQDASRRLRALPGIGEMKARTMVAVLTKIFGVPLAGTERVVPEWMTLGDADTPERLAEYQAMKRAWKAEQRAGAAS